MQTDVNLATFGEFMTELVDTASDVTLPSDTPLQQRPNKTGRDNHKLYAHSETEGDPTVTTTGQFRRPPISESNRRAC